MKTKFSRILGVGLTIVVLASMLVISTPASAGNLSWTAGSPLDKPSTLAWDVIDMAVASNGSTGYAVVADNNNAGRVYKTTNGGTSWTNLTGYAGGMASKIAVAPDVADGSFAALIVGTTVMVTTNGGATWSAMGAIPNVLTLNSISISPMIGTARSVAVAGTNNVTAASVWYFTSSPDFGGTSGWVDALNDPISQANGGWGTANVTGMTNALAVAFSPNYLQDRTLVAITTAVGQAWYNLANVATKKWNMDYTVYGMTAKGIEITGATAAAAADIDLPGSFMAFDTGARAAYVAISGTGGLYRVTGASTSLSTVSMWSVAVNAAGDKLVAGATDTNTVYRAASPSVSPVTVSSVGGATYKAVSYSGTGMTTVEFFGANVGAATTSLTGTPVSNDETAFGLSADDGKTFNDVAFVDSTPNVKDLAVNSDASKVYLVTENGAVTSLWRKTTAWERVLKVAGMGYIVRPALDNFDVAFVAQTGTANILYTNDAGQTVWQPRISYKNIDDFAAQSNMVMYVLSGGLVSKATDGGYLWDNPSVDTKAGSGGSLTLLSANNLVAAGSVGVAYSTDGGTTWTSTGLGFANAKAAMADKLADGGKITAIDSAGVVKQFTIGTSTAFGSARVTLDNATQGWGLAINSGLVYAIANNGIDSTFARQNITATSWTETNVTGTTLSDIQVASGNLKAINSVDNSIWTYTDAFATVGPTQTLPVDKYDVPLNVQTGNANDIPFQWTAIPNSPNSGVEYNLQISLDSNFTQVVYGGTGFTPITGSNVIIGPNQGAGYNLNYSGDTTYYWRIRASGPVDSAWSSTRTFKIGPLAAFQLDAPMSGATGVSVMPTFVWTPVQGATTYEIVVSDDPTFKIITFSRTTDKPLFASDESLAYDTVYYWRVRASAPATAVTQFVNGIFTTEMRPVTTQPTSTQPPVTITQTNTTLTVSVPPSTEAIPAYLLWIIIGIGAILVIALIVLIVRTRRVS